MLNPARIEAALDKAIAILKTHDKPAHDRQRLASHLRYVERTLENLTETAAKGGAVPAVLEAPNRADAERRALLVELKSGSTQTFRQGTSQPRLTFTICGERSAATSTTGMR